MNTIVVALCLAVFPSASRVAQEPPKPEPAPAPKSEVVRASEWPKLAADVLATVNSDIQRLRKAGTETMGEQAHAALVAAGAGVAPLLVPVLGKEKDPSALDRCTAVLDLITGAEHTRLMAVFFADKSSAVRAWALLRCAKFPDAGVAALAEEALVKAKAIRDKDPKAEGSAEELYAAALCTTATGSHKALPMLADYALAKWGKYGGEIRTALTAVRDDEATEFAGKWAADADRKKCVAGLNLLAGCGTKGKGVALVRPHLDNTDNSIRVAAINAMRGIVDNDPPIANLPVFEAIELAKKWKERAH